ncbi:nuclear transport factor 2 family protein [Psychrobacter immobilis]|uniref:nuclear transport factor 2 family protein n=1 Tax=Psychrobacter immobilis TaxID=498 RepID=UPI00191B3EED|nr:nuclear transport factor 2 family protein [Psychrobacter immobilis]
MKKLWGKGLLALLMKSASVTAIMAAASTMTISAQAATMTESLVQNYVAAMKSAANSQNTNQVARLVSDDALISMSRKGKSTSLDKDAYLKLLQNSWSNTSNYRYDINVDNIVITGDQAKANVTTNESWVKDGQKVSFVTTSRVTLTLSTGNAVLLRAVSQVAIN